MRTLCFELLALALAPALWAVSIAQEQVRAEEPRKRVELPGIVIDLENRLVDVEGTIRVTDGPLELVACTKDSKEHESIVAVAARPMHIHTALLLLGATNGNPAMRRAVDEAKTRWENLPPRGDTVEVSLVVTSDEGKPVERAIGDFILPTEGRVDEVDGEVLVAPETHKDDAGKPPKKFTHTFVFAGSLLVENGQGPRRYLADESGDVVSIATFGDEVLSLPFHQSQANDSLSWRANPKTLPPAGTKVTLRLRPQNKNKRPTKDSAKDPK